MTVAQIVAIAIISILILWVLGSLFRDNRKPLEEDMQLQYIRAELGIETVSEKEAKGIDEQWYVDTRAYLKNLTSIELKQKAEKLCIDYPQVQEYKYFLDIDILIKDELNNRPIDETKT